jgi:hypothetical protein
LSGNFEDFSLLYGRVRVIAENRTRPIVIRGGRAATKAVEGDFAISHNVQVFTIEEGESMSIAGRRTLGPDIEEQWNQNMPGDWRPEPVDLFTLPSIAVNNRGRNISIAMGLIMTAASAATIVISHPRIDIIGNRDFARNLNFGAYIPLGMGLATTLGGILYNPASP